MSTNSTASPSKPDPIQHVIQCYGDLLFDFCESILWSPQTAQIAFRAILKEIKTAESSHIHSTHERAWVLRIACEKLKEMSVRHGRKLTSYEQVKLNSSAGLSTRLKEFDSYFHRLTMEEQILLLLRDKYGLPYPEISASMGIPEGSLKTQRQQALRALEEWLWDKST